MDCLWKRFIFICFVIFCSRRCLCSKLNLPRVLLPLFHDFSTTFTLEVVEGGCFKWKTSRLDVIQLIPLDVDPELGCSSKAVISTISKESTRNTVIVFAEEISVGQVLRCDVIVDVISSLNIVTTTRELFMEEAPELFEVRAYDDQGNEFTTLEGVEFQWTIGSWNDHSHTKRGSSVLRFISFRDSPYETPPTIAKFDTIGLRGHIVLLEGIKTGSAKVSVQLPHTEYRHVPPIEVQLIVVANLLIDPPDAYIMQRDIIKYKLLQVQHGKLEEIPLPSTQYYLEVEDNSIAVMHKTSSSVRGLSPGRTKIILRDRNVDASESGAVHLPTASLTVTTPAYLTLSLLPHRNWAVLVNQLCTIVIEMFDSDNHKMCIGESTNLITTVPEELFELRGMTRNGSHLTGFTIKSGTAPVNTVLESVRGFGGELINVSPTISAHADLEIYPRLAIKPSEVVLPWYPHIVASKNEAKLKATGGDGLYLWSSNNQSVVLVTQSGVVKAQNQGQTDVVVSMQRNQHNSESAKVHVLPPGHMEIVEYILEAEVGAPIFVNIAVYAYKQVFGKPKKIPFTRCQDLPFKVKVWESNFYYNATTISSPVGVACASVAVIGTTVGSSKVTITYTQDDIELESSTIVAAYQPLEVVQPPNCETVLAIGSSRHIVWTGGPRPWLGRNFQHSHTLDSDLGIVEVQELFNNQDGTYVYNILCRALGEADVTLTVENKPAALANYKSAISMSTVKVFCAKPRYISLMTRPVDPSCPTNINTDRIVAHCSQPLKLMLIFKDDRGRIFDNATSFQIDWLLSKKSLASLSHRGMILLEEIVKENYLVPLDHYQIVIPNNETGLLKVSATLTGYNSAILNQNSIIPESPPFGITDEGGRTRTPLIEASLMIVFVNDTIISPNKSTIFNHPTNKIILKVSEGSGHYNVIVSTPDVAVVNYIETSRTLEILPRIDGSLKIALVDLCLPSKPAVADIQVLRVGSIKVDVIDRIEKGHSVTAFVHLYDSLDNPLSILDVDLLELRPSVESDIISLKPVPLNGKREIKFTVTGIKLGETKLIFKSGRGINEIQSSPVSIQVFPPLRLVPRNLTLVIGAVFQLNAIGGPQPDANMEYFSSDQLIAKVSSAGLVETSRLGDIHVTGMAVGLNKVNGNKIIFCKDTIEVHVIPLEGIKIQTPLYKLKVGARIPVWAAGIPDVLSPLVLGFVQPPILFKWNVSSPDIIELRDVFFNTGIEIRDKDKLSMRVKALKPGRATLHLSITTKGAVVRTPEKMSVILSDFIELEVFEELRLIKPDLGPAAFKPILLAPETTFQLQTNKDGVDKISYSVLGYPYSSSGSGANFGSSSKSTALTKQGTVLTVDGHGLVSTGPGSGRALILLHSDKDYGFDQTIGVNVEVKPVYYLMMNINAKLRADPDKQISALPRGLDLEIILTYHDNTGSEFAATRTDIRFRTNRFDKMHVTRGNVNGSLFASLAGSGSTVLKVWDEIIPYHSEDYIKFNVEHLMFPDKTQLVVGDLICFSMPLLSESHESGKWSSADPDILMMERSEGIARATGKTGSALVTYYLTDAIAVTTAMQVLPITSILFLPLEGRNVSNTPGERFQVSLLLLNDQLLERTRNMIAKDNKCPISDYVVSYFPFSCEVRFNSLMTSINVHDVFVVRPFFSNETGLYSCQFEAAGPPSPNISTLQSNITLRAVSGKVMSDPLVVPFLPAVFVHTPEIHLSDKQPSAFLTITGTPQVLSQIKLQTRDSLLALDSKEETTPNSISYAVKLKPRFWSVIGTKPEYELNINLISPLTSENIMIPVIIHMRGDSWMNAPCLGGTNDYLIGSDFDGSRFSYSAMVFCSLGIMAVALYYGYFTLLRGRRHDPSSSIYASPNVIHSYGCSSPSYFVPHYQSSPLHSSPCPCKRTHRCYGNPCCTHRSYGNPCCTHRSYGYHFCNYKCSTAAPTSIFQGNSPVINSPHSPDSSSYITRQPFSDMEPIYGDPNLSHSSPDLKRRTRRLQ